MTKEIYKVKLEQFEGPLDLLLHLIKSMEIDIYDIPMSEITNQYLDYIHTMKFLELDVASEYLVMAATLIEIKSQMLLPKPVLIDEDHEIEEDPREELMQKLIAYRKYKAAAETFKERAADDVQTVFRPVATVLTRKQTEFKPYESLPFFELVDAFKNILQRQTWREPIEKRVNAQEISAEDRKQRIISLLEKKGTIRFEDIFVNYTRTEIVVTFLSILQLLKENKIYCQQDNQFGDLMITKIGVAV